MYVFYVCEGEVRLRDDPARLNGGGCPVETSRVNPLGIPICLFAIYIYRERERWVYIYMQYIYIYIYKKHAYDI